MAKPAQKIELDIDSLFNAPVDSLRAPAQPMNNAANGKMTGAQILDMLKNVLSIDSEKTIVNPQNIDVKKILKR